MDERKLYLLLDVIQKQGDARRLLTKGMDYQDIANLTTIALKEGFILLNNKKLQLSEKGIIFFKANSDKYKRINKEEWIQPHFASQISKIDKNDIFLPKQDELTF